MDPVLVPPLPLTLRWLLSSPRAVLSPFPALFRALLSTLEFARAPRAILGPAAAILRARSRGPSALR